jgi:hypothetical protein
MHFSVYDVFRANCKKQLIQGQWEMGNEHGGIVRIVVFSCALDVTSIGFLGVHLEWGK